MVAYFVGSHECVCQTSHRISRIYYYPRKPVLAFETKKSEVMSIVTTPLIYGQFLIVGNGALSIIIQEFIC